MKSCLSLLVLMLMHSCSDLHKSNCQLIIDSNYIRKSFDDITEINNKEIISLINSYENIPIQNILDSVDKEYKQNFKIYSIPVKEFKNRQWHFFIKKESYLNSLSSLKMFMVKNEKARINDIVEVAHILNNRQFEDRLSTCISDTIIITTRITKYSSDISVDGVRIINYDSLIHIYTVNEKKLTLREQNRFKKYYYKP